MARTAEGGGDDRRPLAWGLVLSLFFHAGLLAVPLGTALLGTTRGFGDGGIVRIGIVEVPVDGVAKAGGAAGSGGTRGVLTPASKPAPSVPVARVRPAATAVVSKAPAKKPVSAAKKPVQTQPAGRMLTAKAGTGPVAAPAAPDPVPTAAGGRSQGGAKPAPIDKPAGNLEGIGGSGGNAVAAAGGGGADSGGGSGQGIGGAGTGGFPTGQSMLSAPLPQSGQLKNAPALLAGLPAGGAAEVRLRVVVNANGAVTDVKVEIPPLKKNTWSAASVREEIRNLVYSKYSFKNFQYKGSSAPYIVEGRISFDPDGKLNIDLTSPIAPLGDAGGGAAGTTAQGGEGIR